MTLWLVSYLLRYNGRPIASSTWRAAREKSNDAMLPNPPPNLRSESMKPIAMITGGYGNLNLSLMIAPTKESTITSSGTVSGELAGNICHTLD